MDTSYLKSDIRGSASALSTSFAGGDIGIICTPTFISAEYLYSILNRHIDTIEHIYYISDSTNLIKVICGQLGIGFSQINYYDFKTNLNVLYAFTDGMEPAGFKLLVEEFKEAGKEVNIFKTAFIDPRTGLY